MIPWIYAGSYEKARNYADNENVTFFHYVNEIEKLYGLRHITIICLSIPSNEFSQYALLHDIILIDRTNNVNKTSSSS